MSFNIIKSIFITILFFVFVYSPIETNAQGLFKSFDSAPPTGGSSGTVTNNSSGNSTGTAIFVIGGIAAAAILIYKLTSNDKDKVKKEPAKSNNNYKEKLSYRIEKLKDKNTNQLYDNKFQLYLGIKRETPILNKKTYVVGVSFSL